MRRGSWGRRGCSGYILTGASGPGPQLSAERSPRSCPGLDLRLVGSRVFRPWRHARRSSLVDSRVVPLFVLHAANRNRESRKAKLGSTASLTTGQACVGLVESSRCSWEPGPGRLGAWGQRPESRVGAAARCIVVVAYKNARLGSRTLSWPWTGTVICMEC